MAQGPRPAKIREWSQRMARYAASGQTVTEFCKAEQVSLPSFYHWKKKLGDRGTVHTLTANSQRSGRPAFQKVRVVEAQVSPIGLSIRLPNNVEIVVANGLLHPERKQHRQQVHP